MNDVRPPQPGSAATAVQIQVGAMNRSFTRAPLRLVAVHTKSNLLWAKLLVSISAEMGEDALN